MNRKITSEEEFFANNPAAKKAREQKKIKQIFIKESNLVIEKKKIFISMREFLKQIKKKLSANQSKIFNLKFFFTHTGFIKKRNFFFQKNFLFRIALLLVFGWFFFWSQLFFREYLKVAKLKKTLEYLSSKKNDVINLQKNIYYQYPTVEVNIKKVLEKLNITVDEFIEVNNTLLEKTIKISIKNLDYSKFLKLIYELENASPTLILNFVRLYNLNNNNVTLFLEISGLI